MSQRLMEMNNIVELCQKLISFKTDNNNIDEAFAYLKTQFSKISFSAEIIEYYTDLGVRTSGLFAQSGQGHTHLLFAGHIDVVAAGEASAWRFPPHQAVIEEGALYGRGASDMLGGLAAFFFAVEDLKTSGTSLGKISFLLSGDEERPLVNTTKCLLETVSERGEKFDFCIVGEPSNPEQLGQEIKIGRRGDVFIKIKSIGQEGHTAYPHLAHNPIHNLVDLLFKIQNLELDKGNEFFDASTIQVTTFDVDNSAMNVIPREASTAIDIRFNSLHSSETIIAKIRQLATETAGIFLIEPEIVGESFLTPISAECEVLKNIIRQKTGIMPKYTTGGGTSDARFIKDYCPVLEFGLTNATIHKSNECAKVSDLELLKEIYKDFIIAYFARG